MKSIMDLMKHDKQFLIGFLMLIFIIFFSLLSFFSPYDPQDRYVVQRDLPPSAQHILGTNSLGQDVFWFLTFALKNSLIIGILAVVLGRIVAIIIGLLSGYIGGTFDRVITTITDSFIVLPRLPILILLSFILKGNLNFINMALLLAFFDWAWPSKRYRSQILSLKEMEFTNTARFSGRKIYEIIFKEHIPFLIPYIMADAISGFLFAIGMEITLSVLGLTNLDIPTIGTTIFWANYYQSMLKGTWWWISSPIVVLIITVLGFYLLSVSISTFLDPRIRIQSKKTGDK
ncbi:MAG TPA: ABC transporter permease [Dictyoglomaceae bacterium]|nr:ABC transporter permease [Dictyoglomaceae bacterium]